MWTLPPLAPGRTNKQNIPIILFQGERQRYMLTKERVRHWEWVQLAHSSSWQQLSALSPRITPAISHRGTKPGLVQQSTLLCLTLRRMYHSSHPNNCKHKRCRSYAQYMVIKQIFKTLAWLTETYWQHTVNPLFIAAAGLFQHPGQSAQAYSSTLTLTLHKYTKCLQTGMCCNAWSWTQGLQVPTGGLSQCCPSALPYAHLPQTDGSNWLHASLWLISVNSLIKLTLLIKAY